MGGGARVATGGVVAGTVEVGARVGDSRGGLVGAGVLGTATGVLVGEGANVPVGGGVAVGGNVGSPVGDSRGGFVGASVLVRTAAGVLVGERANVAVGGPSSVGIDCRVDVGDDVGTIVDAAGGDGSAADAAQLMARMPTNMTRTKAPCFMTNARYLLRESGASRYYPD